MITVRLREKLSQAEGLDLPFSPAIFPSFLHFLPLVAKLSDRGRASPSSGGILEADLLKAEPYLSVYF